MNSRRHHEDDLTPSQHERLLMIEVAGESEGPGLMQATCHLMFCRDLVERGRIGESMAAPVDAARQRAAGARRRRGFLK